MSGQTLFEKVWQDHIVVPESDANPAVLYIDLHLIHEVTTPQAFDVLRERGLPVRRPDLTLATMDHSTPTVPVPTLGDLDIVAEPAAAGQIRQMIDNCNEFGIALEGFESQHRGIVHVIGPELGATQPGKTMVCGDSHSSTHGAFGALAFGIGSTEVGHVLATQTLLQRRPKTMAINITGTLKPGVGAKDVVLALMRRRRCRPCHGISRQRDSQPVHGTAYDHLQHDHRRRRPGWHDCPRRHHGSVPERPAPRAAGR
jgi:3-isopropylmalate/(R)-2-methylmalate dehydratase large subunit